MLLLWPFSLGVFSKGTFSYSCNCAVWDQVGFGKTNPSLKALVHDSASQAQVWFNGVPVSTNGGGNELHLTNPNTPALATSSNDWKVGTNTVQVLVTSGSGASPSCEYQYILQCNKPAPGTGGQVVGDPQFVGLRGQNFQIHGVAGEIYNIVSDPEVQYNSRFVFLHHGECPIVHGRKQRECFSHPGSYLGELGLKTAAGDQIHLVAGPAKRGFDEVTVNGREVLEGETILLAGDMGSVTRNSTHMASVDVGNWQFRFESSDRFVNQRVRVAQSAALSAHGLLGQTWKDTTYPGPVKFIEGSVDDYVISGRDIWGDNFVFNAFN